MNDAMKHLILMRHASAGPGDDDRARPLSPHGAAEAERMGRALASLGARGFRPEHALVSPARRTRETFEALRGALGELAASEDEALYLASPGQLLARLQALPDPSAQVLLIGHNPGLAELVRRLVGRGDAQAQRRAARGLVPAASAALRIEAERWRDLAPGCAELVAFLRPDD
jgi:phosphohistidine phosphatase